MKSCCVWEGQQAGFNWKVTITQGYKTQSLLRVIQNEGLALYYNLTHGVIYIKIGYCGLNSDSYQNYLFLVHCNSNKWNKN